MILVAVNNYRLHYERWKKENNPFAKEEMDKQYSFIQGAMRTVVYLIPCKMAHRMHGDVLFATLSENNHMQFVDNFCKDIEDLQKQKELQ